MAVNLRTRNEEDHGAVPAWRRVPAVWCRLLGWRSPRHLQPVYQGAREVRRVHEELRKAVARCRRRWLHNPQRGTLLGV